MRLCMEAKTECEAPLNKDLSGAEVCEGDGFDRSDLDCLLLHRKSMAELTDCKAQGYLKVKRECFNKVWSNIVRTRAEALLKRPHVSDDLVECALSSCFNNTECFHNYHHELAQNPASHRVFNLTLCAFVSTDYPLECDHRNCTLDIAACKHLDTASMPAARDIRCFPCTSSDNITEKHGFRSNLTKHCTSKINLTELHTSRSNLTEHCTFRSKLTERSTFRSNLTEHRTSRRRLELG
ncbi:unnamed protein product [Lampetra planeri]